MTFVSGLIAVRYFTANEPYHYTIDNRPLQDISANVLSIATALDSGASPFTTVSLADGSVAGPSFNFVSDTDTGLYFYSAGGTSIGVAINGADTARFLPAGMTTLGLQFSTNPRTVAASLFLTRETDNVLGQRNGVSPQSYRLFNTYTDPTNFERLGVSWATNILTIATEQLGTGVARNMIVGTSGAATLSLQTAATNRFTISSAGHLLAGADNTYDFGAAGATRPRDVYIARDLTIGGITTHAGTAGANAVIYRTSAVFNGTTDQGTFFGYNTNLFGQIPNGADSSILIGMEADFNDGVNHYVEYHVNLARPTGSYVRPFSAYMNRTTGVLDTGVLGETINLYNNQILSNGYELRLTNADTTGPRIGLVATDTGGKTWQMYSTGSAANGGAGYYSIVNATDTREGMSLYSTASAGMSLGTTFASRSDADNSSLLQIGNAGGLTATRTNIRWRNGGFAAPSADGSLSNGDKAVFWNTGGILKIAMGVESNGLWFQNSGATTANGFKWYGGTSTPALQMMLTTGGELLVGGNTTPLSVGGYNGIRADGVNGGFFDTLTNGVRIGSIYSESTAFIVQSNNLPMKFRTLAEQFRIGNFGGAVNYVNIHGRSASNGPVLGVNGTDTNINMYYAAKGTGYHGFFTATAWTNDISSAATEQFRIVDTPSADRIFVVTGSNGANPLISTTGGSIGLATDVVCSASLTVGGTAMPQNSQSVNYTAVIGDANKHILHPAADNNPRTFTIPANASVAYAIGVQLTFVNLINTVSIAITTDTLILAGAGTTGTRTLAANGVAIATKVTATSWIITGTGLT